MVVRHKIGQKDTIPGFDKGRHIAGRDCRRSATKVGESSGRR